MVFEIDPDKPDIPALARILSGMGILCMIGSVMCLLLAFSRYSWINEIYAMAAAVGAFLLALLFVGQAKILELLAVVSTRVKSRFAIDHISRLPAGAAGQAPPAQSFARPATPKERIIHVPDDQAREQGFKVR